MADPYDMASFLQGRRNPLLDQWATPPTLAGASIPNRNLLMQYGKGSVQSIPEEPLGQANVLSRLAGSFGQPSLDMMRQIREEGQRTGRLPEWGFNEALAAMGTMPMGPFGSVRISNPIRAYHGTSATSARDLVLSREWDIPERRESAIFFGDYPVDKPN